MTTKRTIIFTLIIIVILALTYYINFLRTDSVQDYSDVMEMEDKTEMQDDSGMKYLVDPAKITGGGPPKDGIPSIDEPKFVSVQDADDWIDDNELVLILEYKGITRIYPLQIMVWHEIVNDTIAKDPILITYCPLCGSGIAYKREINGEAVEFGTSGKLYNSNLVMYDRKTDTYWSQIDGKAIIGELTGQELEEISIDTVVWSEWRASFDEAEVLSQDTGFRRQYGKDPYGSYYEDSFIWFPVEGQDDRIHPKTVIFGIEINGQYKAYKEDDLKELTVINDTFAGKKIKVKRDKSGIVRVSDAITNKEIVKERGFWFSWYAFHPETELYQK